MQRTINLVQHGFKKATDKGGQRIKSPAAHYRRARQSNRYSKHRVGDSGL